MAYWNHDICVASNCAVLTEGFDDPAVDAILMARPTQSRPLYVQSVGRGLRRHPGKVDCQILDFVDASKHKLVTVLDLFGRVEKQNANGLDVLNFVDGESGRLERQHVIESQHPLEWRLKSVCPWPETPNLRDHVASAAWCDDQASDKQVATIDRSNQSANRCESVKRTQTRRGGMFWTREFN